LIVASLTLVVCTTWLERWRAYPGGHCGIAWRHRWRPQRDCLPVSCMRKMRQPWPRDGGYGRPLNRYDARDLVCPRLSVGPYSCAIDGVW